MKVTITETKTVNVVKDASTNVVKVTQQEVNTSFYLED